MNKLLIGLFAVLFVFQAGVLGFLAYNQVTTKPARYQGVRVGSRRDLLALVDTQTGEIRYTYVRKDSKWYQIAPAVNTKE